MRNEDLSITGAESAPLDNDENGGATVAAIVTQPAVRADAMLVTPGPDGIVTLPDGVELDNIQVVGRDLVIALPDGGQMVVVDGAIFVPQLVIGTVEVPPTNLAALLIGNEPEPAGGPEVQSSGGNFAVLVPDLGPRQPLGDLLPPTERFFDLPTEEEIGRALPDDNEPDIVIISDDNPTGVKNATADVSEAGLPARNGEPAGSDHAGNSETTAGTIVYQSPDSPNVVAVDGLVVNGVVITAVGQQIEGLYGTLTITSIAPGVIGFSYTLRDNTSGDNTRDIFTVTITDVDGDTDSATLTIHIADDVPTARNDTGNQGSEDAPIKVDVFGNDTPGADGVNLVSGVTLVAGSLTGAGSVVYNGDGTFTYTPAPGEEGQVQFRYRIVDSDGDPSTATVTINLLPDSTPTVFVVEGSDQTVDEAGLDAGGSKAATDGEFAEGDLDFTTGNDTLAKLVINGQDVTNGGTVDGQFGKLTITVNPDGSYHYVYELTAAIEDLQGSEIDSFSIVVVDSDGDDASTTLDIEVIDDLPEAKDDGSTGAPIVIPEDTATKIDVFVNDVQGADGVKHGDISLGTQALNGTAVYNGDGTFTYTPNDGYAGPDSFTYTIEDADGDVSTATVYVDVSVDSKPQIGTPQVVTVDEDGLIGANPDDGQTDPLEVNGGGVAMASGSVIVNFGADVPANPTDALALFSLLDDNALDGQLSYNGQPVTFALVGGKLVGSADGDDVIVIEVESATIVGNEVTYTYKVTLLQELDHAAGDDSEALTSLVGIGFQVKDPDTDFAAQSSFDVKIYDDVPTSEVAGDVTVVEGQTASGTWSVSM
ncbi:Ig-like domain-containing protein, partial [Sphingomicrobium lutaoense]